MHKNMDRIDGALKNNQNNACLSLYLFIYRLQQCSLLQTITIQRTLARINVTLKNYHNNR